MGILKDNKVCKICKQDSKTLNDDGICPGCEKKA